MDTLNIPKGQHLMKDKRNQETVLDQTSKEDRNQNES
jgi:hypothetical protein